MPDEDPLTECEQMRSIHHHRHFWLFEGKEGKPVVLYRRRAKKGDVTDLIVEWGDLTHPRFNAESRREFTDAWKSWREWKEAMA